MAATDRTQRLMARIEADIVREADNRAYWLRHQRGEVSDAEAASRLASRFRTVRLMIDGQEPAPDQMRATLDELQYYRRSRH